MRLAPLIPLLLLGIGVAIVELLSLRAITQGRSSASLLLDNTLVNISNANGKINFYAEQFLVDDTGSTADQARGRVTTADRELRFNAAIVTQPADQTGVNLQGNVEIWHGEQYLQTNRAHIEQDGSIAGDVVKIVGPEATAQAQSFRVDSTGAINLQGNVRTKIQRR